MYRQPNNNLQAHTLHCQALIQINEEFYRIGNPADKDGNIPENYKHWVHRDRDRQLAAERAREEGTRPVVGTPEVVCERIEILRSKGINRIFGKFGAAGLDADKTMRCIEMFANQVMPEFAEEPVSSAS